MLPGETKVVARGNALGKGPVLFCLGADGVRNIRRLAAGAHHLGSVVACLARRLHGTSKMHC